MSFSKIPEAILDYSLDWSNWLGEDRIDMSTWTVPAGITKTGESQTSKVTTIWLSGGLPGKSYSLCNEIVTAAGRKDKRAIIVSIEEI